MIAGIDIGTSYSSICVLDFTGKVQPVDIATGTSMYGSKYSLPSAVFVEDDGTVLVGQAAMNNRRHKPGQFCMEFKRSLGQDIPILLGSQSFMPEDLYREIFIHMRDCVKRVYGEDITIAYVTCPAAFGRKKREKVMSAAKAAGLFDVVLADEPTAAAASYLSQGILKDGQKFLMYDFGGGTFDVSLLCYENGSFKLLAEPGGIEQCGGIDLDRYIYQDMRSKINAEILGQIESNALYKMRFDCQLGELAVKIKHQLSSVKCCEEFIPVALESVPYKLTREKFEEMAAPFVGQTIEACRAVLKNAQIEASELSAVLMAGGTSRIPLVRKMVQQFTGNVPVYSSVDMELAVAMGAVLGRNSSYRNSQTNRRPESPTDHAAKTDINSAKTSEIFSSTDKSHGQAKEKKTNEAVFFNDDLRDIFGGVFEELFGTQTNPNARSAQQWLDQGEEYERQEQKRKFEMGSSAGKDDYKFLECYRKAAELGNDRAQNILGFLYAQGEAGLPKNDKEALKWFEKAAGQGNPSALYNLAVCYVKGRGVRKDYIKAIELLRESEKKGKIYAADEAGAFAESLDNRHILEACGGQINTEAWSFGAARFPYIEIFEYLLNAAQMGNVKAQYQLALCYEYGQGTVRDYARAALWYSEAAKQGHTEAQYLLACCYSHGWGVPQNKAEAQRWYKKAASHGHLEAKRLLEKL